MREAYRLARRAAPGRVGLVIVARPGALQVRFAALVDEMRSALAALPGARP